MKWARVHVYNRRPEQLAWHILDEAGTKALCGLPRRGKIGPWDRVDRSEDPPKEMRCKHCVKWSAKRAA